MAVRPARRSRHHRCRTVPARCYYGLPEQRHHQRAGRLVDRDQRRRGIAGYSGTSNKVAGASQCHVTVTVTSAGTENALMIYELGGTATTAVLAGTASTAGGSGTAVATGSVTGLEFAKW